MPWIRRKLRDSTIYMRVKGDGTPIAGPDGRVDIRYKPTAGAKVYRAALRNLARTGDANDEVPMDLPEGEAADDTPSAGAAGNGARAAKAAGNGTRAAKAAGNGARAASIPGDAIIVYTDGACTGNPGPAGIGVVILDRGQRRELSEYLGQGTNNIAELTAIERALEALTGTGSDRPVVVHSDSSYAIGLLSKGWKAKANTELVARIRKLASAFPQLRFVKVLGHSGVPENERCDELARMAVVRRA